MSRIPLPAQGLHHYNSNSNSNANNNTNNNNNNNNNNNGINTHSSPRPSSPLVNQQSPNMSASPATDTRKKQSKRDETTAFPPNTSDPLLSSMTTQKPLDTPPSSVRTTSSETLPTPPLPDMPTVPAPPVPQTQPPMLYRTSSTGKRGSVQFPSLPSAPAIPTPPVDDVPQRPRYHSSVSRSATATLSRSESSSNFAGKLKSLRKKIENELSRKRTGGPAPQGGSNSSKRPSKKAQKGTVAGLRPSPALTVPESMSVADASQLCAAKRTDCVLVVDDEEGLSGIFTAKDLAFRVTAEGLDPRTTLVSQIMTKNPMVTRDTTGATEALQLMVSRGFRHLPVCNEDGDVVGLLDITKVFHEALAKVERGSSATTQLHAALAGVQSELGPGLAANPQAAAMLAYVDALRDRMALPDLTSVMDARANPPTVTPRTSVREAAKLMKERRTTAVCVMEANAGTSAISGQSGSGAIPKIAGIFTSKDIVLRVIAAGLDASRCSVVRVMTPHPDTAPPTMIVQDALKKMHNGHYLNLPVVEEDGRLIGIVDVLKLTYATLEQIESMSEDQNNSGGPMWGKFFDALNHTGGDDDSTSVVSASDRPDTPSRPSHARGLSSMTSPISEVMPNDSASVADDDQSEVGRGGASSVAAPALPVDDGTYIFKFRTPSGRTHRFQARHDSFELLRDIVAGKLATDPFFHPDAKTDGEQVHLPDPNTFSLSYTDDDGDLVTITADGDVSDAVRIARGQKSDRVVLLVDGGKVWEEAARDLGGEQAVQQLKAVEHEVKGVEDEEEKMKEDSADPAKEATWGKKGAVHSNSTPVVGPQPELVAGIPKDLVLPAAIGFLGVVIIGVFFASRK